MGEIIDRHRAQLLAGHQDVLPDLKTALLGDVEFAEVLETDRPLNGDPLLHEGVDGREGGDHQNDHREQQHTYTATPPPFRRRCARNVSRWALSHRVGDGQGTYRREGS